MVAVLVINSVTIKWTVNDIGPRIIALAQGLLDPLDLADWAARAKRLAAQNFYSPAAISALPFTACHS